MKIVYSIFLSVIPLITFSQSSLFDEGLDKFNQADFNATLAIDSNHALAWFNRGLCRLYTNDIEGACSDWKKALKKGHLPAKGLLSEHCED